MKLLSWMVYLPLQVLCLPVAAVGAGMVGYRQLVVSKRLGVSQTAIEVFNGRFTLHIFGMRDDPGAEALGPVLPNTSVRGLWLALFPLWVKARIAGEPAVYPRRVAPGHETLVELITGRTVYFDQVLERRLPEVAQFVLLGAGMDTRPYGALALSEARVFEVDQSATQGLKRTCLREAGIATDHVTFVTIDFSVDDLFETLSQAGFDPAKKTVFLWEGVTLYLSEEAVRTTMMDIARRAATGSVLLADLYAERVVSMMQSRVGETALAYTKETAHFSLDLSADWAQRLEGFVEETGLTLGAAHFMGTTSKKGPFMVVAEMTCGHREA